jgi:hypothetical protein
VFARPTIGYLVISSLQSAGRNFDKGKFFGVGPMAFILQALNNKRSSGRLPGI